MDTLTFLAEVVKATAWPATTVVVTILFRKELRGILLRLRKGNVGSAEFEFQEAVTVLAENLAELSPAPRPVALDPEIVNFAEIDPRGALLRAWFEVEATLIDLSQRHGLLNDQARRNPMALLRSLVNAELIPRDQFPIFIVLRRLCNQAAHEIDFKPPEDAVLGYLEIAEELKQLVREAGT